MLFSVTQVLGDAKLMEEVLAEGGDPVCATETGGWVGL